MDPAPTTAQLDAIASNYPGGDMHVFKVLENSRGRYCIQWEIDFGSDSWLRFVNAGGWRESLDEAIRAELCELQERMKMNIFGTNLFPYLQGEMLKDAGWVAMTIKHVGLEDVANDRGKEEKPVVYFTERPKGLILNKTNARAVAALYGPETNDWHGKRIFVYAEQGTWFGKTGYAIRVGDRVPPTNGNGTNGQQQPAQSEPPSVPEQLPFDASDEAHLSRALEAENLDDFAFAAVMVVDGYFAMGDVIDTLKDHWPSDNGQKVFRYTATKNGEYLQWLADVVTAQASEKADKEAG